MAAFAVAGTVGGCSKKPTAHYIAELRTFARSVESQLGKSQWTRARVGHRYNLGDAIRTGPKASAKLELSRGGAIVLDADTLVRFRKNPDKKVKLDVEAGGVVVEAPDKPLQIETSIGAATIERRGRVRLRAHSKGMRIDVLVGTAVLENNGQTRTLNTGQGVVVDIGGAVIEEPTKVAKARSAPDAGVPPAPKPSEEISAVVKGKGSRIKTKTGWKPLAEGEAKLRAGTAIRVGKKSSIEVSRGDQRAIAHGPAQLTVGGKNDELITASSGLISILAKDSDAVIAVPGGVIVAKGLPGGSRAEVAIRRHRTSVQNRRGEVAVKGERGEQTLRGGEAARLSRKGGVAVHVRIPTKVAFSLPAGESATIHDPKAPTAVHIHFAKRCPDGGTLQVSRRRNFSRGVIYSPGRDGANVLLKRGLSFYRVVCNNGKRGRHGWLRVRKDFAHHPVPRRPHHTIVDADGRLYKVLYQNHLPKLTFRWLDGPKGASRYTLHIRGRRTNLNKSASTPRYHIRSGGLREGTYTWWWSTDTGHKSDKTRLIIDFDNAAATAYLRKVRKQGGGVCHVEGATIKGVSVSVNGSPLALDRHQRFKADLTPAGDETAVAIRISHRRGLHYYVVTVR